MQRKILHIDMDAFYASVEQNDNPELRGKPIAVGGSSARGVVAAASYEARAFGVKSAMPGFKAKNKCPNLIFVKPRFSRYKEISNLIRDVFYEYTDKVEPLSLDEAYLDVTNNKKNIDSAIKIAKEIRKKIKEQTGLTASAGVSINKFLAKVASDIHKPNGLTVILPDDVQGFIDDLAIEKFYGVGKATSKKMKALGIHTGKDLFQMSELDLRKHFGKMGSYLYKVCRGEDDREVKSEQIRKSISVERTFEDDLTSVEAVNDKIEMVNAKLYEALQRTGINGRTVVLKIKYDNFSIVSRSKSMKSFSSDKDIILNIAKELFAQLEWAGKGIRLIGLGLSNLDTEQKENQLKLSL